jgi:twinkle protein|tara:strand:+ start:1777 stop:3495 length:1719 start_codon:yes stop_codon:yes gene_type:complete
MGVIDEVVEGIYDDCRIVCPECGNDRKKKNVKTLSVTIGADAKLYYCHHCSASGAVKIKSPYERLPKQKVVHIQTTRDNAVLEEFLSSRGIPMSAVNTEVITGEKYFNGGGNLPAVGFVYVSGSERAVKWRSTEGKYFTQDGAARWLYGIEKVSNEDDQLVICEGEVDVLALSAASVTAVSCPNGAPQKVSNNRINPEDDNKFSYLWDARDIITNIPKIILATDNDQAGEALAEEIARRVGRAKCWRVNYPEGCKDSNDVLLRHGADELAKLIANPTPMPLKGVYAAQDYANEVKHIYTEGVGTGVSTGLQSVDDLFTVSEGQLSVVTGLPSSGKSEFIDQIMINMAQKDHWKFAVCSFENPPHFHIAKLAEKIIGKPFFDGPNQRISNEELDTAIDFIDKHFVFLDQKDGVVSSIDSIIDRAKQAVLRLGVRGLVIDPYNYIEQDGTEEHISISAMLTKVTTFCKAHGIHCWFVAHPAKVYPKEDGTYPVPKGMSISGSAAWFAKADLGITVHRTDDDVEVHCWKCRFKWVGKQGVTNLNYDLLSGRYSEKNRVESYSPDTRIHWYDQVDI